MKTGVFAGRRLAVRVTAADLMGAGVDPWRGGGFLRRSVGYLRLALLHVPSAARPKASMRLTFS
jgi:hypothetical protein